MKARMELSVDTLWANQVTIVVEAELDNPDTRTTRHLATLMTQSLQLLHEEAIRAENERIAHREHELSVREDELARREQAAERDKQ